MLDDFHGNMLRNSNDVCRIFVGMMVSICVN